MSFEVGIVERFTARHHLVGDFGPASEPHAHDYRVEARVRGRGLLPDGTLFDITKLQDALRSALAKLDGRDLNTLDALGRPNPTAEVVARFLFVEVAPALGGTGVEELHVEVWESDDAYAAFAADPATSRR